MSYGTRRKLTNGIRDKKFDRVDPVKRFVFNTMTTTNGETEGRLSDRDRTAPGRLLLNYIFIPGGRER